jgi:hypothetical protein
MLAVLAVAFMTSAALDARIAVVADSAPFHLYVMPASADISEVTVLASDASNLPTDVRIVYRMSGNTLTIEESARSDDPASQPSPDPSMVMVNGYPALYARTGPYFRPEGHLTIWASGVTVRLSSTDFWDVPALVNAALSLR